MRAKADSFGFRRGYFLKAKIMYILTKDQLRSLTDPKVKEWFSEVFEVELEVGKWYKRFDHLFCYQEDSKVFGFNQNGWETLSGVSWGWKNNKSIIEASNEEVFEALKNEAVKRGFVDGACVKTTKGTFKEIGGGFKIRLRKQ